jgi:methylated-DNA-[protein]-cysteine S-methyltransferase
MTDVLEHTVMEAPWGPLGLVLRNRRLTAVALVADASFPGALEDRHGVASAVAPAALAPVVDGLRAYFSGSRAPLEMELDWDQGTPFQQAVWRAMTRVPYGCTVTYGGLAKTVGRPGGAQAVGRAAGANPIPIVVPCHRVVAGDGDLGGFTGGLDIKKRLLALEGSWSTRLPF